MGLFVQFAIREQTHISAFPHQIVVELTNLSPKIRDQASFSFISGFSKATCKYFNYFGPWTADVQGPPPQLSPMSLALPSYNGNPPPTRAATPPCPHAGPASRDGAFTSRLQRQPPALPVQIPAPKLLSAMIFPDLMKFPALFANTPHLFNT